jgi:endonuclease G, mitochondrial
VSIPEEYFKVALDLDNKQAIGFIMPNRECENPVMHYACSIDSIEKVTGIDFFANLPDDIENSLEASYTTTNWLSRKEQADVQPLRPETLPRNTFNTLQAQYYMGKNETIRVCGTVVSTKLSAKGNIFINLDKRFPNQVFSISIFSDKTVNFSYKPEEYLAGKTICVTGKVTNQNGTPTINIANENAIEILDEDNPGNTKPRPASPNAL